MKKHKPDEFDDSVMNQTILTTGDNVGDLAMGYFGDYVEIPYKRAAYADMAHMTQELIEQGGTPTICEATFMKDGCFCMVDILRSESDGMHLIEVKSSTKVKDYHLADIAFQIWLLEECGLSVKSASLMHLNSEYVREGELDIHELFVLEDVTDEARMMSADVAQTARMLAIIENDPNEPHISIGAHCDSPFECGFKGWCWREVPKPSVHDIVRLTKERAWDLHNSGIVSLDDVADEIRAQRLCLNEKQVNQVMAYVQDLDDIVDERGVSQFLNKLSYPLYYLDFETIMPAVPPYDGMHPYQQLPTQYSLHWEDSPDGSLRHTEFLAEVGEDPRRAIAERLCEDIPADVCVMAYNMAFEKGRIKELADRFPDLRDLII